MLPTTYSSRVMSPEILDNKTDSELNRSNKYVVIHILWLYLIVSLPKNWQQGRIDKKSSGCAPLPTETNNCTARTKLHFLLQNNDIFWTILLYCRATTFTIDKNTSSFPHPSKIAQCHPLNLYCIFKHSKPLYASRSIDPPRFLFLWNSLPFTENYVQGSHPTRRSV